jgi:hypothetical protein
MKNHPYNTRTKSLILSALIAIVCVRLSDGQLTTLTQLVAMTSPLKAVFTVELLFYIEK